jgi:hypothetical protein
MTALALILLALGVVICWVTSGVQWPAAVVFTTFGVAIAGTAMGHMVVTATNGLASAAMQVASALTG